LSITKRTSEWAARRSDSQPKGRSAGSVFRNPERLSAGELIDRAGCKGERVGGATVSERHANFIINDGTASAHDIRALMALVVKRVEAEHGITLVPEVESVGFEGADER